MIIMEIDSMPNEDGTVTTTAEFEHNGVYGCYIETVDERNDKMPIASEFHHMGVDGYLLGGNWKITGELDDSLKEGLNELLNAGL